MCRCGLSDAQRRVATDHRMAKAAIAYAIQQSFPNDARYAAFLLLGRWRRRPLLASEPYGGWVLSMSR